MYAGLCMYNVAHTPGWARLSLYYLYPLFPGLDAYCADPAQPVTGSDDNNYLVYLLRGAILNRMYGTDKNLYIFLFLPTVFGLSYYGPP